ncbi:hypothetical protein PN36_35010 [Candidatus Thiomargarita nelsonii]|uniref:Antitoxin SocA-like Panacea domain-containing protein n=1 Tax=Candidatus Thiomargarita nelsonii TaxID=1003181 RepID=A0A4E0QUU5_9GAMM|nr:hypothetical protein PN36_35010 [Candidatus Thiomargarita nelsonii]
MDILKLAYHIINEKNLPYLNHLKLQKLLYYIQSWHLVFRGQPLFEDYFEAWVHGPVARKVYAYIKTYVSANRWSKLKPDPEMGDNVQDTLDPEQMEIIEDVLQEYGDKTSYHLECLTHREKPWLEARGRLSETESCTNCIDNKTMLKYYTSLLDA